MKTCPICSTTLFDDMEVCYGCMYSFGSKPDLEQKVREAADETTDETIAIASAAPAESAAPAGPDPIEREEDVDDGSRRGERADAVALGEPLSSALLVQAARAASALPGWGVRLELRDETAPHRVWSMELTPPRAVAAE